MADRIILLDLNVTLAVNAKDGWGRRDFTSWIAGNEEYRSWLVELLRPEEVALITVRNDRHREATLGRIEAMTGWKPQMACFNDTGIPGSKAPLVKAQLLAEYVFPVYGDDPAQFLALESNGGTRSMYSKAGIEAVRVPELPWTHLPGDEPTLF